MNKVDKSLKMFFIAIITTIIVTVSLLFFIGVWALSFAIIGLSVSTGFLIDYLKRFQNFRFIWLAIMLLLGVLFVLSLSGFFQVQR
ncbi:MAG: hypothetical protein AAB482_02540 [Patescibacteria group bacterium]